ncbi:hypothetical protein GCM10023335_89060 [Streptomyces siamensis]|uniref:Uncharacterized protein n=1 Tax=Streptomyces siamensis TaxID=1274986 RepID=A0ABP9JRQ3_9ACTN
MSTITPEGIISHLARALAFSTRTPILRRPAEYGMAYEDGVPLPGGWPNRGRDSYPSQKVSALPDSHV